MSRNKARKIKYKQCQECQFWIATTDGYCQNCKARNPIMLSKIVWVIWFAILLPSSGMTTNFISSMVEGGGSIFIGIIAGFIISFTIVYLLARILTSALGIRLFPKKPKSCLRQDEQKVHQRLQELQEREKPVYALKKQAAPITDLQKRQKIENTLKDALAALRSQGEQYRAKLWEIQLVRWHNTLKPLLAYWMNQNERQYHSLPEQLLNVRQQGQKMLSEWKGQDLAKNSIGRQNINRLIQALKTCDQLYQDIIAYQATKTVKTISHFETHAYSSDETIEALNEVDIFTSLPDVDAFSSGLQELEKEYFRLQSEKALGIEI